MAQNITITGGTYGSGQGESTTYAITASTGTVTLANGNAATGIT